MDRYLEADLDAGFIPVRVEQHYDRSQRSWVTLLETDRGEQVGSANYDGTRADAAASKAYLQRRLDEISRR